MYIYLKVWCNISVYFLFVWYTFECWNLIFLVQYHSCYISISYIPIQFLLKNILHDKTFNGRNNLEKLLTAAKFINHENQVASTSRQKFAEHTQRNSFLGQVFLIENGMTQNDTMRKIINMEAKVMLTVTEKLILRNVTPSMFNMTNLERVVTHEG